ncbi:ISL3 family transposase [Chamaesiphon sp.]|uniref:ISL3 family transposase n=1 Tax=Chamaesiphon sp. TaxID=2814140 RepID=UPI00359313F4
MNLNIENFLNLPKIKVVGGGQISDFYALQLQFTNEGINCPHCQKYLDALHQIRHILVRDLSICGMEVYLKVPKRRFYCRHCQKYTTEQVAWLDSKQLLTNRFKEYIYIRVKELTVEQVSRSENLGSKQVQKIFNELSKIEIKTQDWGMPKRLSLDEFSKKKGQGKFATILTDLDTSSLLEVIDSHKSDDIITILKRIPQAMREQVEEVSVDMWGGFPKVIREVFPNAKTVIDRFHVQKLINKNLNTIRLKLELKGLKNKNLLMTTQSKLTALEKIQLELMLQTSPILRIAHELKEDILKIYNSNITPNWAIKKMKKWLASARIILGNAAETLNTHLEDEKFVELLHRLGLGDPPNNENVADTIYGVLLIMQKEIAGMGGLTEELVKEFVDEFYILYTLKLAKGLNSIESVSGNVTIDNIKESKRELVAMFQSYGYSI